MNADLDALATRLYVTIDDLLKAHPHWQPERPAVGIAPQLTDWISRPSGAGVPLVGEPLFR